MHSLTPLVGQMSMIDVDASAFIQLGIVALTFLMLRSLVFGPLLASISARSAATEEARAQAKAVTQKAAELAARYEADMLVARVKAAQAKAELRSEGVRQKDSVVGEARAAMARKLAEVRDNLAAQADSARRQMQPQVEELSRAIASKLLGRNL